MTAPKRILIVDDEKRNRNLLEAMLKSLGHKSETANDGIEALEKIENGFDLLLLDVMMPGMDGFQVARRIREHPVYGDLPIVMVTVLSGKEDRLRAVQAGANDFISKPIDKTELQVRMDSLLRMKEAQDQVKRHQAELEQTVRKRTEELRKSEARFRTIIETAQDCIFVQDRNLIYTHANPAMARLFGRPANEIEGLTDETLLGPEGASHNREVATRVLRGETVEEERTRLINGASLTFHEVRAPIRDCSGSITGVCGITRNITERKSVLAPLQVPSPEQWFSPAMRAALDRALLAAAGDSTILLTGESGSGKDYMARVIHENSRRANGPFFTINCAAVAPELAESELFGHEAGAFTGASRRKRGLLELAEGGTLLLNEVGELPPTLQAKLLTFLDTMSFSRVGGEKNVAVNARLIAATNRDLQKEISNGRFRIDLYYRLNVYTVVIPPLRERVEDIPVLARRILSYLAAEMQIESAPELDAGAERRLCDYPWPGNVRELRNVLERSIILGRGGRLRLELGPEGEDPIKSDWCWSAGFPPEKPLTEMAADLKRSLIEKALDQCKGKRVDAARVLKVSRDTLKRQMRTLGFFSQD